MGPNLARTDAGPRRLAGAALALATVGASELGARYLLLLVTVAVAVAALELAGDFSESGLAATPVLYAVSAAAFPVAGYLWLEPGLAAAAAFMILLVGARFVLSRPARGTVLSVAAFVLSAVYVSFGAAYLVLLRLEPRGARAVLGLLIIALLYHAACALADTFLGRRPVATHLSGTPSLAGIIAGSLASFPGVVAYFALTHHHLRPQPVLAVGLAVGAALSISAIGWGLMRPDRVDTRRAPAPSYVLGVLQSLSLAAPALFYAARLVLS